MNAERALGTLDVEHRLTTQQSKPTVTDRVSNLSPEVRRVLNEMHSIHTETRLRQWRLENDAKHAETPRNQVFLQGGASALKQFAEWLEFTTPGLAFEEDARSIFREWCAEVNKWPH